MDFELTQEQKAIQKAADEFAAGAFKKEIAQECDVSGEFPREIWKKACELGFIGVHYDEKYGGQGLGCLENALVVEQFCRRDSGIGTALMLSKFGSEMILRFGSEEQKLKYLTPLTKGEAISCGCFTEPEHGSDITLMSTTAQREGDEYLINGTKVLISSGTIANIAIVLCQTDLDVKPTHRGQSLIIVECDRPGFTAIKQWPKMGIRPSPTGQLSFNDVRVPRENLVGEENRGFYHALEFLDESRIETGAQALGIAQGAFDRALEYAKQRQQFGRRIIDFQVTQHKLADMAIKIETARLIVYKAAWNRDQGRMDAKLTSMAKAYAGRVAVEVADEAIQIFGGYGYMSEYDVERYYRDAKVTEIYEGTKEIQKNTIASALMGRV